MPPKDPSKSRGAAKTRTALCNTCGRRFRVPDGWSVGAATRRHYWAKHREVMQPDGKASS